MAKAEGGFKENEEAGAAEVVEKVEVGESKDQSRLELKFDIISTFFQLTSSNI